ncbi:MAG TPA: succinate dehydrogenase cytochrome b subunit [Methylomirabilota bacterium]|nr:succinate dehydrogenase cytochrome b subunit [Methylomirabilota bacterium]
MNLIRRLWNSTLGKKYVMAVTGAGLFIFAVGHLVGNLQVFGPPELINGYAHFLKSKPLLLWGARLGLLACAVLHIVAAVQLAALNRAARPEGYVGGWAYGATRASQSMIGSGMVILAFVVYHLAHFTVLLPAINGTGDFRKLTTTLHGQAVPDVYAMMVLGFQVWWVVAFYLVAQALLFMHLGHGLAAMFQSLGLRNHVWWPRIQRFAKGASIALFVGYAIIPLSIFLRLVGAEYGDKAKHQFTQTSLPAAALVAERNGKGAK